MGKDDLFVEKYRPTNVNDIVGLKPLGFDIGQAPPHLLLYGSPGTGKTTLAKIITKTLGCDLLTLNAGKDRGIDVVRSQISTFAPAMSVDGKVRIIFLDEADGLTVDAQNSLRNVMEEYSGNCRFILTCNDVSKIIEPIQSRCTQIEFGNIKVEDVVSRLEFICKEEKIPYEVDALRKIAMRYGSDLRSAINKVQELREGVTADKVTVESKLSIEVFELLKMDAFEEARQRYLDAKPNDELFLHDLFEVIMGSTEKNEKKRASVHAIAVCLRYLKGAAWKQIQVADCLLTISEEYGLGAKERRL